jgi:hypothetical protein
VTTTAPTMAALDSARHRWPVLTIFAVLLAVVVVVSFCIGVSTYSPFLWAGTYRPSHRAR